MKDKDAEITQSEFNDRLNELEYLRGLSILDLLNKEQEKRLEELESWIKDFM